MQKRIKYIIHITLDEVDYNARNKENKQQGGKENEADHIGKTVEKESIP